MINETHIKALIIHYEDQIEVCEYRMKQFSKAEKMSIEHQQSEVYKLIGKVEAFKSIVHKLKSLRNEGRKNGSTTRM